MTSEALLRPVTVANSFNTASTAPGTLRLTRTDSAMSDFQKALRNS